MQPRFQGFLVAVSFAFDDSVLLMSFSGYCTPLPNLVNASWLLKNSVGHEPIRNGEKFGMINKIEKANRLQNVQPLWSTL